MRNRKPVAAAATAAADSVMLQFQLPSAFAAAAKTLRNLLRMTT